MSISHFSRFIDKIISKKKKKDEKTSKRENRKCVIVCFLFVFPRKSWDILKLYFLLTLILLDQDVSASFHNSSILNSERKKFKLHLPPHLYSLLKQLLPQCCAHWEITLKIIFPFFKNVSFFQKKIILQNDLNTF